MGRGYMGKILWVDLSKHRLKEETPAESVYRDFIGGYGLGAKVLYDRMKPGADPLGPENILGVTTGPLTGTAATFAGRYTVVGKSPLTGGWGDANSGGHFGPTLKFAGYDAVFFTGISEKPVYLFIDNGKAEIRDATHLWGKDCFQTEDMLKAELGEGTESICIGPPGEQQALISCIVTRRGAVAGRSGLGAVMGSKKLKAVAAKGKMAVPVFDAKLVEKLRNEHIAAMKTWKGMETLENFHKYGTSSVAAMFAHAGDAPVKNWGGIGIKELPDVSGLTGDAATANISKRTGCWHCPVGCEGQLKAGTGEYKYPAGTRRVEYETQASFGTMCLNANTESINMVNHICNCYGLDTISAGTAVAFAMECYEKGIITKKNTGGIDLTWGDHQAIVALTEQMAKGEGLGKILADGVKIAAEKFGKGAYKFAVHIGGQELGMHDPKFGQHPGGSAAARYFMDATPGRHTQHDFGPEALNTQITNTSGFCIFADLVGGNTVKYITGFMRAVTGWDRSEEQLLKDAERVYTIRHAFNLREGLNPLERYIHPRIIGNPPHAEGPLAGVTANLDEQVNRGLAGLDWDKKTTYPSRKKLLELGLENVARDLYKGK